MAGERNVVANAIAVAQTGFVLMKVLLLVGLSIAVFTTAYLGYFILPFVFMLLALSIVGLGNLLKQWARFRDRRGDD